MEALLQRKELSFVFVGGKGGVGKTTSSAAIATQFSYDRKVLLLSTDPAHSLSDAFRCQFSGVPQRVSANLEVMEVNPELNLKGEIEKWTTMANESGYEDLISNVKEFQEWLLGIPGIDEATALANVIGYIESGAYDVIVFDTAPTGHTLKLLNLPKVLQLGLDKLSSWQSKLWSVWQVVKGKGNPQQMQKVVMDRLSQYKQGVEKIAVMLKDNQRTNFVVVCIAEHLSVNETCRLLQELKKNQVGVSHIIVNQLVTQAVNTTEFALLDSLFARSRPSAEEEALLTRVRASIQLTNARRNIQQKYLSDLANAPEAKGLRLVEVPLLPTEITGSAALLSFSQRLVTPGFRPGEQAPEELVGWTPNPSPLQMPETKEGQAEGTPQVQLHTYDPRNEKEEKASAKPMTDDDPMTPKPQEPQPMTDDEPLAKGTNVLIHRLSKAPQYNGLKGVVVGPQPDGRIKVSIVFEGARKTVSFQRANLSLVPRNAADTPAPAAAPQVAKAAPQAPAPSTGGGPNMSQDSKAALEARLLADPEVVEALKNPKYRAAYDDIKANPMKFMQYMADPELGPFCQKMMAKMMKS